MPEINDVVVWYCINGVAIINLNSATITFGAVNKYLEQQRKVHLHYTTQQKNNNIGSVQLQTIKNPY